MNLISKLFCGAISVCLWIAPANPVAAQTLDRVFDTQGDSVSGAVKKTSPQAVQLERAGSLQTISSGDIRKIMFEGDPAPLTRGREFAVTGEYDQALSELKKVAIDGLPRKVIKADAEFYLALSHAKLALAGKGDKEQASRRVFAFAGKYKDSWHFFDATRLLGDLALALNDTDNALKYYGYLANAPGAETKIEAVYLKGLVQLRRGDAKNAQSQFEKIINLRVQTARSARIQAMAKAGKAVALAQTGQPGEALDLIQGLIAEMDSKDVEIAARIYNAQGSAYEAAGDDEGALLAYLHTDLMFSAQPDAHAEALKRLVDLWEKVGKPGLAAETRQELKQRYPGF